MLLPAVADLPLHCSSLLLLPCARLECHSNMLHVFVISKLKTFYTWWLISTTSMSCAQRKWICVYLCLLKLYFHISSHFHSILFSYMLPFYSAAITKQCPIVQKVQWWCATLQFMYPNSAIMNIGSYFLISICIKMQITFKTSHPRFSDAFIVYNNQWKYFKNLNHKH